MGYKSLLKKAKSGANVENWKQRRESLGIWLPLNGTRRIRIKTDEDFSQIARLMYRAVAQWSVRDNHVCKRETGIQIKV